MDTNTQINVAASCTSDAFTVKENGTVLATISTQNPWHFTQENQTHVVKPGKQSECWCLELKDDTVKVYNNLQPSDFVIVSIE